MRVLLEYCFDHDSARKLYNSIGRSLRRWGASVDVVRTVSGVDVSAYDVLISHDFASDEVRGLPRLGCFGGRELTRPEGFNMLRELEVAIIPWALADDRAQVLELFDHWQAECLLVKRSGTCKGKGVSAFDRASVDRFEWDPIRDIFCPDVSARDGNVYRAELFNGRMILSFVSLGCPLRESFGGFAAEIPQSMNRRLHRFPTEVSESLQHLSRGLTKQGLGFSSVDMMRVANGTYLAIEINAGQVATWWSARYRRMHWRYARATRDLIVAIGARR